MDQQHCSHQRVVPYSFIEEDFVHRVCDDCGKRLSPESGDPPAAAEARVGYNPNLLKDDEASRRSYYAARSQYHSIKPDDDGPAPVT